MKRCKDCDGKEPECTFSVNEEGQKNDYCEACIAERLSKMAL